MGTITTIKVYKKTKVSLEQYREHKRESYDDVVKKMLYIMHVIRQNPELGKKLLEEIESTKRVLEKRKKYGEMEPRIVVQR